jgi:hypothetical protein
MYVEIQATEAENIRLFRHELQHVYQMGEIGKFKWLFVHLWQFIKHRTRNYPLEVDADLAEELKLTDQEWVWFRMNQIRY